MDPYGILPYLNPHFATKKITIWVIAKKDRKKRGKKDRKFTILGHSNLQKR
jgi:hypothetical protein